MSTITETPATTATADEGQLVAEKPRTVMFLSRRRELRLVKVPRYPVHAAGGRQIGEEPGEAIAFRDGRCDVDPAGDFELEDGRKVPGSEILAWLAGHKRNGDVNEGFWEVDHLAPAPSSVELEQLVAAATELDADKLSELIRQEEEGWGREQILTVARGALEKVRAMHEAARAAVQPDPVEQAQAAAREQAPPAPETPAASEPDWAALGAQFGITPEEAKARLSGGAN